MTSTWSTHFLSFEKSCCFCGTNSLFQNSLGDMINDLLEIASCFKEPNNLLNVFRNPSSWFIFCKSPAYKSGKYNILKSLCYVKHVNLINLDPNWIQGNRSCNPGLFYLNKLHLVAKRHFVPVKCISTSVGNICKIKNILQLKKANKPVPDFLINNADFPPLIFCLLVTFFLITSVFCPLTLLRIFLLNLHLNLSTHLTINLFVKLFVSVPFLKLHFLLGMNVVMFL